MVDDRRAEILRAVVQQYIETSQPVSSTHVVEVSDVHASSATVRAEMAALERDGFLQQPHTSAGRIPTDLGYRFFVDQLGAPDVQVNAHQEDVRRFFAKTTGELEQMLHAAGNMLSKLTGAAAVVVGPDHDTGTVRSAQIVSLGNQVAIVVVVLADGSVEKRTIEFNREVGDATVAAASVRLNRHLTGFALSRQQTFTPSNDETIDYVVAEAANALAPKAEQRENVYVGGASRVAEAFDAVETVRQVLTLLEQQYVVATLISDLLDRGVTVSIGTENNLQSLAQCSLVVSPTFVNGEHRGSVAILGPTRMDYASAMAAVRVVSTNLGKRLSEEN